MLTLESAAKAFAEYRRPTVACLCGSSKFKDLMLEAAKVETLAGNIVLMPHVFRFSGDVITLEEKERLNGLHYAKIDMSDTVVMVSDSSGYLGANAALELDYARSHGKGVRWYGRIPRRDDLQSLLPGLDDQTVPKVAQPAETPPVASYVPPCPDAGQPAIDRNAARNRWPGFDPASDPNCLTHPGPGGVPQVPDMPEQLVCLQCGLPPDAKDGNWMWTADQGWRHFHGHGQGGDGYVGTVPQHKEG